MGFRHTKLKIEAFSKS